MVNCAHPLHVGRTLVEGTGWNTRVRGLRANASTISRAELDEAETLDIGDPADLGTRYAPAPRAAAVADGARRVLRDRRPAHRRDPAGLRLTPRPVRRARSAQPSGWSCEPGPRTRRRRSAPPSASAACAAGSPTRSVTIRDGVAQPVLVAEQHVGAVPGAEDGAGQQRRRPVLAEAGEERRRGSSAPTTAR